LYPYFYEVEMIDPSRPALLVVEDDDFMREAVDLVLSYEGYRISSVRSGEDALTLIGEVDAFEGLYTDIDLLGLVDGWEVGAAFHRRWPAKPIVYASAYEWRDALVMPTGIMLRKPLRFKTLVSVLTGHDLLDQAQDAPALPASRSPAWRSQEI
jgi:CheY-like chemotaxis protein